MQIVTTHKNADFDALASVIAATLAFPGTLAVLPRSLNPNVKAFLSIHKDLFETLSTTEAPLEKVERLIVVDANCWSRLERMEPLKGRADLDLWVIDHHREGGTIPARRRVIEEVGATTTLLVRELRAARKTLTPMQATLFLAGIYEDTGNLSFPSTRADDAYAAAWLLERRADLDILHRFLRPAYSERHKEILFRMLKQARRLRVNGHRISIPHTSVEGQVDGLAVVVRMYMEILNVDAAFGIFHDPAANRAMVIGRSQADSLDVGSILRRLGGGGHPRAGSARLRDLPPEEIERRILEIVRRGGRAAVQIGDLMSYPVWTVGPSTSMEEAAALLREKGITGIPVVEEGRIVGMISRRDFRKIRKPGQLRAPVKAFMATAVVTVTPAESVQDAARLLVRHDIGRLPVVEDGRLLGILTRSDVMRYLYDLLPD
ncbi:MAG: CBS domain-containing protein [Desulfobacterales bacterium]